MALFRNKLFVVGAWLAAMLAFYLFFRRPPAALEAHGTPATAMAPMRPSPAPPTADVATPDAASGEPIEGTITVAPELKGKASAGDTLFIIARKGTSGPPLAAKKLSVSHFPLKYTLGPENVMMQGMPWEGELQIIVRVDKDGNATTKSPGDIMGTSKQLVKVGSKDADITLDQAL
jgi:hypothetical protein